MRTTKSFAVLMSLLSLLSLMSLVGLAGCGDPTYSATIESQGGAPTMPAVTKYQDTVADAQTGRPIANATVTITNSPSGTAATRYDSAGNVNSAPLVTDKDGWFSVYLTEGLYNITVAAGNVSKQYVGVMVGPSAAYGSLTSGVFGFTVQFNSTITYARVGKLVTIQLPQLSGIGADNSVVYLQPIPAGYRPSSAKVVPVVVTSGAGMSIGTIAIDTNGSITLFKSYDPTPFAAGVSYDIPTISVSYLVS